MGAMCVSEQEKMMRQQRKQNAALRERKAKQQYNRIKQALNNGIYAQLVRRYTGLYGRPVTNETKEFIQKNYNWDYNSQVRPQGYPRHGSLTLTYKSSLIDRFQTAYKSNFSSGALQFTKLDQSRNYLQCKWQIRTPGGTKYYEVQFYFDQQNKFKRTYFNQQQAPYDHQKWMAANRAQFPQPEPKKYYQQQSSNNYNGPSKDWGAHYAAQLERSNAQFRQNMNKQAQQWNNYATQKNNRGW